MVRTSLIIPVSQCTELSYLVMLQARTSEDDDRSDAVILFTLEGTHLIIIVKLTLPTFCLIVGQGSFEREATSNTELD